MKIRIIIININRLKYPKYQLSQFEWPISGTKDNDKPIITVSKYLYRNQTNISETQLSFPPLKIVFQDF